MDSGVQTLDDLGHHLDDKKILSSTDFLDKVRVLFIHRTNQNIPFDLLDAIDETSNKLLQHDLLKTLLQILNFMKGSTQDAALKLPIRNIVVDTVFLISYQTRTSPEACDIILNLLRDYSNLFSKSQLPVVDPSYKVIYTLLCAFVSSLCLNPERALIDPIDGEVYCREVNILNSEKLEEVLRKEWNDNEIKSIVYFAYSLYQTGRTLNYSDKFEEFLNIAIKLNFSEAISNLVQNSLFIDNMRIIDTFIRPFDEIVYTSFLFMPSKLIEMKGEYEKTNFYSFIGLITILYKNQPTLTTKFWEQKEKVFPILRVGSEAHILSTNDRYLEVLSTLATGEKSSMYAYEFLEESTRWLNWDNVFDNIEKVCSEFSNNIQSNEASINFVDGSLLLLEVIAHWSTIARECFLVNREWKVIHNLFNLLMCPVQSKLKAKIMVVLSKFAPDASQIIWQYLEYISILPKNPMDGSHGIHTEYEQVETKNKKYNYTIAFIDLLNVLCTEYFKHSQESLLVVDFTHYIDYVVYIFESDDKRGYIDEVDRWTLATSCLKLFETLLKFLDGYTLEELEQMCLNQEQSIIRKSLKLFQKFLHKSNLLLKTLDNIDYDKLKSRHTVGGSQYENVLIRTLSIIEFILVKQNDILSLESILDDQDHQIKISLDKILVEKFVFVYTLMDCISWANKKLWKLSISITRLLCQTNKMGRKICNMLSSQKDLQLYLIQHYSSIIEVSLMDEKNEEEADIEILKLMIECCSKNKPNFTQLLLGYNTKTGHYLDKFVLLEKITSLVSIDSTSLTNPHFTMLTYELICKLLYHVHTQTAVSTYFSSKEFFRAQLALIPGVSPTKALEYMDLTQSVSEGFLSDLNIQYIFQRGWLIKSYALQLHLTRGKSIGDLVVSGLYDELEDDNIMITENTQERMKMRDLLDILELMEKEPAENVTAMGQNIFRNGPIQSAIFVDDCYQMFDIKVLSKIILQEESRIGTMYKPELLFEHRTKLLEAAVANNRYYKSLLALSFFTQAWGSLLEVTFSGYSENLENNETVVMELLRTLFNLLNTNKQTVKINIEISKSILLLTSKLRNPQHFKSDLLIFILNDLLKFLEKKKLPEEIRINIYGSLLNYLNKIKLLSDYLKDQKDRVNILFMMRKYNSQHASVNERIEHEYDSLKKKTIDYLTPPLKNILSIISSNCIQNSNTVLKLMALTTLNALIKLDKKIALTLMESQGDLNEIIGSLYHKSISLSDTQAIFSFDCKMSLLVSLALSPTEVATRLVNDHVILKKLEEFSFLDGRPRRDDPYFTEMMDNYEQLLLPTLQFILALLSQQSGNTNVIKGISSFLGKYSMTFLSILEERAQDHNIKQLIIVSQLLNIMYLNHRDSVPEIFQNRLLFTMEKHFSIRRSKIYSEFKLSPQLMEFHKNLLSIYRVLMDKNRIDITRQDYLVYLQFLIEKYRNLNEELLQLSESTKKYSDIATNTASDWVMDYSSISSHLENVVYNIEMILLLFYKSLEQDRDSKTKPSQLQSYFKELNLENIVSHDRRKVAIIPLLVRRISESLQSK